MFLDLNTVRLDCGGPMRKISVNGKLLEFEDHAYCGPNVLNQRGEPLAEQPRVFLLAASLWVQQGRRIEDGLCRWDHEPEPITKHMGGRHHKVIGWTPARKGE